MTRATACLRATQEAMGHRIASLLTTAEETLLEAGHVLRGSRYSVGRIRRALEPLGPAQEPAARSLLQEAHAEAWQLALTAPRVIGRACRGTGGPSGLDIEDVRSEATRGAMEGALRWRVDTGVDFGLVASIWARRYVGRLVAKHWHSVSGDPLIIGGDLVDEVPATQDDIERRMDLRLVARLVQALPPQERAVVRKVQGLEDGIPRSLVQASRELGVAVSVVQRMDRDGRQRMAEMFERTCKG